MRGTSRTLLPSYLAEYWQRSLLAKDSEWNAFDQVLELIALHFDLVRNKLHAFPGANDPFRANIFL